ncbi:histidinol-phosphatase [Dehalobacter sp. DCM]|uniref:histidinol-phosphatase n=1 Tax=Dehalobacter sp. DCM TaxID=2907827 RepID=UPI00308204BF|nr:histidinol-phosphatase [Dehalobacter sp. DCM]
MLDLHVHLLGHRDREANRDNIRSFLGEALRKKLTRIGFADHDYYWHELNFDLIRETALEYPELEVRVGLEVDYREENEESIRRMIDQYDFDYIIGSVHEIKGWLFDYPEEEEEHRRRNPDQLYTDYFSLIEKAARSGLFDIIGHIDLVKLFGIRPYTDVRILAKPALEVIKQNGLVVEVNTNGRYKAVNEFYPDFNLIETIKQMDIAFTLGSDAHEFGNVGRDLFEAAKQLESAGVRTLTGFTRRIPDILPIKSQMDV